MASGFRAFPNPGAWRVCLPTAGIRFKVARTSFLARGMDFQRASRVRNTIDKGARFKTQKTKTNMAARGFFCARSLLYRWPRNSLIKQASLHRNTCINSVYLRITKNCFRNSLFPVFPKFQRAYEGLAKSM